jgi:predicted unusual protein kinase regulating ubiquinone biosynthesis (AarF/ABC1/UbiB family)
MSLMTYIQSQINSLRFLGLLKQKNKKNELVELALKEKGVLFKLIQNLSPELLENTSFQVKAIPQQEIINIIELNLNIKFIDHFKELSKPIFCASIGQVHKAILKDGQTVAIKIQYPNAQNAIASQLKLLKAAVIGSKISNISKWNIDLNSHISMIEERLREELDYGHELKNLIEYSKNNHFNKIQPYLQYSSSLVLTQTWIEGETFTKVKNNWSKEKKIILAEQIVGQYLSDLFNYGFFQGDNNVSNFIAKESPIELHWIDFGNWLHINLDVRTSLYTCLSKTINKQEINYLGHFEKLGFDLNKLQYFQNTLPSLLEILFDPFLKNSPFDLKRWELEERINNLLGENKWWFRSSGDSGFLELMKSFFGLIKIIEYLDVNINWQKIFNLVKTEFNVNEIESKLSTFPNCIPQSSDLAKQLIIQVFKNGVEHVKIELPAGTFFDLENLIPDEIQWKLQERKIDISKIKFEYLKHGLIPGKVFELNDHTTVFYVYLT